MNYNDKKRGWSAICHRSRHHEYGMQGVMAHSSLAVAMFFRRLRNQK